MPISFGIPFPAREKNCVVVIALSAVAFIWKRVIDHRVGFPEIREFPWDIYLGTGFPGTAVAWATCYEAIDDALDESSPDGKGSDDVRGDPGGVEAAIAAELELKLLRWPSMVDLTKWTKR